MLSTGSTRVNKLFFQYIWASFKKIKIVFIIFKLLKFWYHFTLLGSCSNTRNCHILLTQVYQLLTFCPFALLFVCSLLLSLSKFLFHMYVLIHIMFYYRLPRWLSGKEFTCQCKSRKICRFDPWVRKILWRRRWQPTPIFCWGNPMDRGAWQGAVHGVAKSQTRLSAYSIVCIFFLNHLEVIRRHSPLFPYP